MALYFGSDRRKVHLGADLCNVNLIILDHGVYSIAHQNTVLNVHARPKVETCEFVQMDGSVISTGQASPGTLMTHTVTFMLDDEILYQIVVPDGYSCTDPVISGKLESPTKQFDGAISHVFSGWSTDEYGEVINTEGECYLSENAFELEYDESVDAYVYLGYCSELSIDGVESLVAYWNGAPYICPIQILDESIGTYYLGNMSMLNDTADDTGEPFLIAYYTDDNGAPVLRILANEPTCTLALFTVTVLSKITEDLVLYAVMTPTSRTVQFIEGSLEEILPEDFGTVTTINKCTLAGGSILHADNDGIPMHIKKITFPKTLKYFEPSSSEIINSGVSGSSFKVCSVYSVNVPYEVVFPSSILKLVANVGSDDFTILDLSKLTQIPTLSKTAAESEDAFEYEWHCRLNGVEVRVKSSMLEDWQNASTSLESVNFVGV